MNSPGMLYYKYGLQREGMTRMRETTLCYIERGDQYLMLHRTKKENDANRDKWIGVGGHLEPDETPEACVLRETFEETGLTLTDYRCRGVVRFRSDVCEDEDMHLFTATGFLGEQRVCDEGDLAWIDKSKLYALTLWEGDRIFLRLLDEGAPFFDLTLHYHGDALAGAILDGRALPVGTEEK